MGCKRSAVTRLHCGPMQFLQRQRAPSITSPASEDERDQPTSRGRRIRCPQCQWEPRRDDRWRCDCGNDWNTFDTYGECPHCGKRWHMTQCLSCGEWSPHEKWYESERAS